MIATIESIDFTSCLFRLIGTKKHKHKSATRMGKWAVTFVVLVDLDLGCGTAERHSHSASTRRERGDSERDRRCRGQVHLPSDYRAPRCGYCRRVGGRLSRA